MSRRVGIAVAVASAVASRAAAAEPTPLARSSISLSHGYVFSATAPVERERLGVASYFALGQNLAPTLNLYEEVSVVTPGKAPGKGADHVGLGVGVQWFFLASRPPPRGLIRLIFDPRTVFVRAGVSAVFRDATDEHPIAFGPMFTGGIGYAPIIGVDYALCLETRGAFAVLSGGPSVSIEVLVVAQLAR